MKVGRSIPSCHFSQPTQRKQANTRVAFRDILTRTSQSSSRSSTDVDAEYSPLLQALVDYDKWKAQQPPQILPESKGLTEENIAYLKERYAGPLTNMEKMDAVHTLHDMGILNRTEFLKGLGTEIKYISVKDMRHTVSPLGGEEPRDMDPFQDAPLAKFEKWENIWSWLENECHIDTKV